MQRYNPFTNPQNLFYSKITFSHNLYVVYITKSHFLFYRIITFSQNSTEQHIDNGAVSGVFSGMANEPMFIFLSF